VRSAKPVRTQPDDLTEILRSAREALERADWTAARDGFVTAQDHGELDADDLFLLGEAHWWLGEVDQSLGAHEAGYRRFLQGDLHRQAAMSAMTIAYSLFLRGEDVIGSGWMSRAERLLRNQPEGVEHGYAVYIVEVEGGLADSNLDEVIEAARRVQDIGHRYGDPNLVTGGLLGEGWALSRQGQVRQGMALLDEVMVAVLTDDLAPEWAGNFYCHLMTVSHEFADVRRAAEWTEATTRWLDTLPAAVLFGGICRVHRSQVMQSRGAWQEAEREAIRVCEELRHIDVATTAEGHYQIGELRRLQGDLSAAEDAYQHAHQLGRDPQPGLALLRLAQGRVEASCASIKAALVAAGDYRPTRFRLRAAQVEISLAARDLETALAACEELEEIASVYGTSGFEADARHWRGAVTLAQGRPEESLPVLREACRAWRELQAPYPAARACVLLAQAYRALDDGDAAGLELEAASAEFERLGAVLESRVVAGLRSGIHLPGGLTEREAEVLALVAAGRTNRDVASSLSISQKTVARHLSNIFTKLGVSSRTEAAAYAFEHDLASGPVGRSTHPA
jgi:DNA-binding CsgD family transcriptional regulator